MTEGDGCRVAIAWDGEAVMVNWSGRFWLAFTGQSAISCTLASSQALLKSISFTCYIRRKQCPCVLRLEMEWERVH